MGIFIFILLCLALIGTVIFILNYENSNHKHYCKNYKNCPYSKTCDNEYDMVCFKKE